jgi:hypothetical protein
MKWSLMALLLLASPPSPSRGAEPLVHGLWVWKSTPLLASPRGASDLQRFCKSAGISEVYLSFPAHLDSGAERQVAQLILLLHGSGTRVEALLSSVDADEPGAPRAKLLEHVRAVLEFNARHAAARLDGIHLDIEPQQRPENKGAGNLRFVNGLVDAYRGVAQLTQGRALSLNADVQVKVLKADPEQRRALLTSIPRLTLMLYELSSPDDGTTGAQKQNKLREHVEELFEAAYRGLPDQGLAKMAIALRTPDYGDTLPTMLAFLDEINRTNSHYLGWARHSYNDVMANDLMAR